MDTGTTFAGRRNLTGQLGRVRGGAERVGRSPVLDALIQRVVVTRDRRAVFTEIASSLGGLAVSADQLTVTPYLLVGKHEEMAEQLVDQAKHWGITRYVVREPAISEIAPVLTLLTEAGHLSRSSSPAAPPVCR